MYYLPNTLSSQIFASTEVCWAYCVYTASNCFILTANKWKNHFFKMKEDIGMA